MELFSEKFKDLVLNYLNSENVFVATLTKVYNDKFTDSIKKRNDIKIIEVSEDNREEKKKFIKNLLRDFKLN